MRGGCGGRGGGYTCKGDIVNIVLSALPIGVCSRDRYFVPRGGKVDLFYRGIGEQEVTKVVDRPLKKCEKSTH